MSTFDENDVTAQEIPLEQLGEIAGGRAATPPPPPGVEKSPRRIKKDREEAAKATPSVRR